MKRAFRGRTLYFAQIPRTVACYLTFVYFTGKFYTTPKCQNEYRFNINELFDRDCHYLYGNDSFRALVRRVNNKYYHLINPAFEIDPEILKASEGLDSRFKPLDDMEDYNKKIAQGTAEKLRATAFNT